MRCKPAPHPIVLQVGVQSIDKLIVLRRVADEARVVLDHLVQQRGQILDQRIWQADAPKKYERQGAGALQCSDVERAGATMNNGVKALAAA
jgi:hypothetical protein